MKDLDIVLCELDHHVDKLNKRIKQLEGMLEYVLEDDGLIPRATSKCRSAIRAVLGRPT